MKSLFPAFFLSAIITPTLFFSFQSRDISPFARFPFDLESGYIVFSVPIEPTGSLSLLFDTGCQSTTLRKHVWDNMDTDAAITLLLGSQKREIDDYHIRPETGLSKAKAQKIDGVIGNDLLHHYTVKIDHEDKVLSLFDNQESMAFPNGQEVGIGVSSLVSSVPLTITFPGGKKVEGEFVIDTGAPIDVLINSPFAEKNGLYTESDKLIEREFRTMADVQTAAAMKSESVRIGNEECADREIYISTSKKGLFAVTRYAGIVGNRFFQNFNIIFDYKRKKLHLERR